MAQSYASALWELAREDSRDHRRFREKGSVMTSSQREELIARDHLRGMRLADIVRQSGWPTASAVGLGLAIRITKVALHTTHAIQGRRFVPSAAQLKRFSYCIEDGVKCGELPGFTYAFVVDRIARLEKRPATFGTPMCSLKLEEHNPIYPVISPETLEQRRAKLDLKPLPATMLRRIIEISRQHAA